MFSLPQDLTFIIHGASDAVCRPVKYIIIQDEYTLNTEQPRTRNRRVSYSRYESYNIHSSLVFRVVVERTAFILTTTERRTARRAKNARCIELGTQLLLFIVKIIQDWEDEARCRCRCLPGCRRGGGIGERSAELLLFGFGLHRPDVPGRHCEFQNCLLHI